VEEEMTQKYKRCPFCGSESITMSDGILFTFVECMYCRATGPSNEEHDDARDAWNTRVRQNVKKKAAKK
jgi:Lar family restriction alleviation protein